MGRNDQAWAVFRCQLLAPLLLGEIPANERGAYIQSLSEQEYLLPNGVRKRISARTLRRWWKRLRDEGVEAMQPQPRSDRGQPHRQAQRGELFARAVELKREHQQPLPPASAKPIQPHYLDALQAKHQAEHQAKRNVWSFSGWTNQFYEQILQRATQAEGALLLVFDEAHLLNSESLTDLRLLISSALEVGPPLKILLAGQESLRATLRRAQHADLLNRVSVRYQIRPLGKDQTVRYIDFQLKQAGGDAELMDDAVKLAIHDFTGGVPRAINNLATACLIQAAATGVVRIDGELFQKAAGEFQLA